MRPLRDVLPACAEPGCGVSGCGHPRWQPSGTAPGPDAILVPTARPARDGDGRAQSGLRLAAWLAAGFGCPLLVVCSQQARAAEVRAAVLEAVPKAGARLAVLELADLAPADLPWTERLRTSKHPLTTLHRRTDVGSKRNYGLVQALTRGWRHLLLLDDDIAPYPGGRHDGSPTSDTLDLLGLRRARAALDAAPELQVVAWTLEEFDDNSVYGHARRLAGEPQQIFASGGALLLRVDARVPFFPEIYNEDWLFLIALAAETGRAREAIGWAGRVHQQDYRPFQAQRARGEEAGDLLGEGLLNLLEDHGAGFAGHATGRAFWRQALAARAVGVERTRRAVARRVAAGEVGLTTGLAVGSALKAADAARSRVGPEALSGYVRDWLGDLAEWRVLAAQLVRARERVAADLLDRGAVAPTGAGAALPTTGGALDCGRPGAGRRPLPSWVHSVHVPNHRRLLTDLTGERLVGSAGFDAVLVPTVRGPLHLLTAAAVARRSGATLVLLCSGKSAVRPALRQVALASPGLDAIAVDCERYRLPHEFDCDPIAAGLEQRKGFRDTATKRNLGLLLAWLRGWQHVLFLDDDVRELRTRELRRARAAFDRPGIEVAGWAFEDYPDHSVLCHAYRGLPAPPFGRQVPFLGGGGMAARVGDRMPFFPTVYNEDWLYLAGLFATARGGRAAPQVGLLGALPQLAYDPFGKPEEATVQEFGDVLGEGLFRLLPDHLENAGWPDYWAGQLEHRRELIAVLRREVDRPGPTWNPRARRCLEQSELARGRIRADDLARWCTAWLADQEAWRQRLLGLPAPRGGDRVSFHKIALWLGLDGRLGGLRGGQVISH